jgi:hypothetical protein
MTIHAGERTSADVEAPAGEETPSDGVPAGTERNVDLTDEKSEEHEATLQDSKYRDRTPNDASDAHTATSEKM